MDEAVFREQVRELKRRISEDSAFRAKVDVDGDGEISGPEWERAVALLRRHLEKREADAAGRTMDDMRGTASTAGATAPGPPASGGPAPRGSLEAPAKGLHEAAPPGLPPQGPSLASARQVVVKQIVESREVVLGYEQSNRYEFLDGGSGEALGGADEERGGLGSFFVRQMLGPGRPLKLSIIDQNRSTWLEGSRPFRITAFINPPSLTLNGQGGPVGAVTRIWPLVIARRYRLEVFGGRTFEIRGRVFSPWTFPIVHGERDVALIKKKWSGFLKESFTDADTFLIDFEATDLTPDERLVIVAAALCVDFDFFEKSPDD